MKKLGCGTVVATISPACRIAPLVLAMTLAARPMQATGTEGGVTAFPPGGEEFGAATMPPPGWYGELMANRYRATKLKDDNGATLPMPFNLDVSALTTKLAWIKPAGVLGADNWGTLLIIPLLDVDVALSPAPGVHLHDRHRGLGDITFGNGLHWAWPQFQMVNAVDIAFPSGNYDKDRLANPGQNRGVFRVVHAATWTPMAAIEFSYRLNLDHHLRNSATDYRSGDLLNFNVALGWKPDPATSIGLAGYGYRQFNDDELHGQKIGNRIRVNGLGVAARHFFPTGQFLDLKWYRESANRNAAEGNIVWIYGGTRF
jgi:hypothetical protein